jgi:hypothetical protein
MKFKSNFDAKKINKGISNKVYKALETSGTSTILALKKRVKRGADADGVAFKSLSKETLARKSARGRKAMFEDSGDMLRSITHKTKKTKKTNSIKLYFDDANENKKAYNNIYIHKRNFFELSDKEIDKVVEKISNSLINL